MELFEVNSLQKEDILIKKGSINNKTKREVNEFDTNFLRMSENYLLLEVKDVGRFEIKNGNLIIWEKNNENVTDDDIKTFILGSALGAILIQRGLIVFHGNALEKDGKAIVCLGHSGGGKSTLAYSLMTQGWNVLSDDLVALNDAGKVLPGIPRIKLWEDVALDFGLNVGELKPIRNKLKKYSIEREDIKSLKSEIPVSAFFVLKREEIQGEHSENNEQILNFDNSKLAFLNLKNQLYRPRFVKGLKKESYLFPKLIYLLNKVPIFDLRVLYGVKKMFNWLNENDLSKLID